MNSRHASSAKARVVIVVLTAPRYATPDDISSPQMFMFLNT
jgi:hypothetical protein